jgi:redox-sensitive bicupin YhaK (pirin superfamily)
MMTIAMTAGGRITLPAPRGRNVFFYIVRGKLTAGDAFHLIEWNDDGDAVDIESLGDSLILFGHAEPLREPVVAHGPFVMNTRDEIYQAIRDYEAGKFR